MSAGMYYAQYAGPYRPTYRGAATISLSEELEHTRTSREAASRQTSQPEPRDSSDQRPNQQADTQQLVTADAEPRVNLREVIPDLQLISQAQRTFIVTDSLEGLYLLDQHTAHERVIYDEILRMQNRSQHLHST